MARVPSELEGTHSSLKNHCLIALRGLSEDYFSDTVIYIIEHNAQGAFGLIINRPTDLEFSDLFTSIPAAKNCLLPVLDGGPVGQDRVFFLHDSEADDFEYTQSVCKDVKLTTSLDIVEDLCIGLGPAKILAILGYAGWDSGQLERELAENVWLISPATSEILFDVPFQSRSETAASLLGVDLHLLSTNAGHG